MIKTMKKNLFYAALFATATVGSALTSCSSDDTPSADVPNGETTPANEYVLSATVEGTNTTNYLLVSAASLDEGEINLQNNPNVTRNDGASQWVFYKNQYLYGLTYNQGNAALTTSFFRDADNQIKKRNGEYSKGRMMAPSFTSKPAPTIWLSLVSE